VKKKNSRFSRGSDTAALAHFILEAGLLKNTVRSGWSVLGIKHAESVAEHSFRCGVLGYLLAHEEGVPPYKVLVMALLNDIHEARIGDLHKMAQRYYQATGAEDNAFYEQIAGLPRQIKDELRALREEYRQQKSRESILARDVDILECLIQALEYTSQGFKKAKHFMKKAPAFLKTAGARRLWKKMRAMDHDRWWLRLSTFSR